MFGKRKIPLQTEVSGLAFRNPVGLPCTPQKRRWRLFRNALHTGFLTLTPPKENVLSWVKSLQKDPEGGLVAVNVTTDFVRTFSLVYDFADFIILSPDSDNGIDASDISDTKVLIDEVVSLRLCYEYFTPIFLRLSHGTTEEELKVLLGDCQLSGIDGVVAPASLVKRIGELTLGRLPVVGMAKTPEQALETLRSGASLVELQAGPIGACKLLKTLENTPL